VNARNDDKQRNDTAFDNLYQGGSKQFVLHDNPLPLPERLSIQQGIFLCPASIRTPFNSNLKAMSRFEKRENIPKVTLNLSLDERYIFMRKLRRMNISSAALFPGLDGFCRSLGEHIFRYKEM
jgi:hypothetical protein